jgi:hypothetical protein
MTIRSKEVLTKLLEKDKQIIDSEMNNEIQDEAWDSFSAAEQEVIRTHYSISYDVHVYFKAGDDARRAGSLAAWAEMIEEAAKCVRELAALGLEIDQADTHSVTLKGPVEKLEEAHAAGLATRTFYLDEEMAEDEGAAKSAGV